MAWLYRNPEWHTVDDIARDFRTIQKTQIYSVTRYLEREGYLERRRRTEHIEYRLSDVLRDELDDGIENKFEWR